ncbi:MAG TPA: hypothetical protein VHU41_05090 [Thermoanaerobaculia bacterium]|nr:hypothetical protein [Thermoanaerobaculia bacterium]
MNPKILMFASACFMAAAGLDLLFAPAETLSAFGVRADVSLPVAVQVMGALYLGFAMLNWMARGSTIGGIYNRPLVLANLTHFFVGALALLKAANKIPGSAVTWIAVAAYSVFAIGFGTLLFGSPRAAA